MHSKSGREGIVAKFVAAFEGDIDAALDELKRGAIVFTNDDSMRQAYDWLVQNRDRLEYSQKNKGQTYKVEIPDDGSYLLWDKPLSEQPKAVKDWVDSLPHEETPGGTKIKFPNGEEMLSSSDPDGSKLYEMLAEADPSMGQEGASKFLRDIGVTGIKYLEDSITGEGEGSYNYVVFDDSAVKVLETYYDDIAKKDQQALDLAERSKSETPTMAQEVQDVESGTAPAVAPVVEQQPTTGQLPGETLGLDEAAGADGPEVGVSDVNATEEGLALTSRLFPKEIERILEAVERGGQFERSTDVNGNEVLTLRTQRTFTGYPSYWQMTRVGDGAVMIDVVIFPDGEAHIAYTEAQGTMHECHVP